MRFRRAARSAAQVSGSRTSSAMAMPTTDGGADAAATPFSMLGERSFARATTATSATSSTARLISVLRVEGGAACCSSPPPTGRK